MIKNYDEFIEKSKMMIEGYVNNLSKLDCVDLNNIDSNTCLHVIIDMNNGFAKSGNLYSDRVEGIIPQVEELARTCLDKDIDTIAFTDSHTQESPELASFPPHCIDSTMESELVDELKALKGITVYKKNSTNGLLKLIKYLEDHNYNTFIISGCVTDICVYQFATTLKAYLNENNISSRVIVPVDCVDTFHIPKEHDAEFMNVVFLNSMIANGIEVVKSVR